MPEASTLAVFAVAALALLVVPGPSVLYIVASSAAPQFVDPERGAVAVQAVVLAAVPPRPTR